MCKCPQICPKYETVSTFPKPSRVAKVRLYDTTLWPRGICTYTVMPKGEMFVYKQ